MDILSQTNGTVSFTTATMSGGIPIGIVTFGPAHTMVGEMPCSSNTFGTQFLLLIFLFNHHFLFLLDAHYVFDNTHYV